MTHSGSALHQFVYPQTFIAQAAVSTPVSPAPVASPAPVSPPIVPTSDTALLFQNDRYAVRVFREGQQAYLNVYDKETQTQPLQKTPVVITLARNPKKDPSQYVAVLGDQQFTVTIDPQGASELLISKGGTIVYRQVSNQVEIARKVPGVTEPEQTGLSNRHSAL